MKNLKNLFLLVFPLTWFIMLTNCQTEQDEIIQTENSFLKTGRLESYSKLSSYVAQLQRKQNATIQGKESSLEVSNGFDILYDQDMYIQEIDSAVTYSIPIHKRNQLGGTFSNLVVRFSETEPTEAFILNYEPEEAYLDDVAVDPQTPFKGKISSELISYDGSLDHLQETDQSGCTTVTIKYCDWDNNEHGDVHLGGTNCTPGFYWFVTTIICSDELPQLMDIPTPGSGDPSATDYIDYDTAGGGFTSSDSTHPPLVVPNVPRTYTNLNIDGMSFEMTDWINRSENIDFKEEMMRFLEEERDIPDSELEAYLMIKSESSSIPWESLQGTYNNIQALQYTHIRHTVDYTFGYNYSEFKLTNNDIIIRGDFAQTITDGISHTADSDIRTYYYSKENKRLFRIPEPYSTPVTVSFDQAINEFWSAVEFGVRMCTPVEDFIILIDGKDFDGVEQSRAVSGLYILLDNVPGGKVFKIVRRAGQALDASVPIIRRFTTSVLKTQRKLYKKYKGIIANMDEAYKGRWGEIATDVDLSSKGYEVKHINRVTSIETGGHPGVDHVFRNPQTGEYLIVESKFKRSGNMAYMNSPSSTTPLPRQMSDEWLIYNDNLANAVGTDIANEILNSGNYTKLVSIINPDGTITYRYIDALGNVLSGASGIYIP